MVKLLITHITLESSVYRVNTSNLKYELYAFVAKLSVWLPETLW